MLASRLAAVIDGLDGRSAVAFDGPDAAGKSTLADRVAQLVTVAAVRASIDGFHAPAALRGRRGVLSPEGYYLDSFDYGALSERLLNPFRAGAGAVDTAVYDYRADTERVVVAAGLPARAVLLVDGVFLMRPLLRDRWTLRVYVHVSEEETLRRALGRDADLFPSPDALVEKYRRRYLPGQALYRDDAHPTEWAHIVIDNEDAAAPRIVKWEPPTAG